MDKKLIIIPAFVIIVLLQWYVPAQMIWDSEKVLETGTEFKFKTAPVDPYDPFRGKYVTLRYTNNRYDVQSSDEWIKGEVIYVLLKTGANGYAEIQSVSKDKPRDTPNYVKAKVQYVYSSNKFDRNTDKLTIQYPFNRFYMEESKAYDAELLQRDVRRDTSRTTYALVKVKEGEALIKDLMINDTSIVELVKLKQAKDAIERVRDTIPED